MNPKGSSVWIAAAALLWLTAHGLLAAETKSPKKEQNKKSKGHPVFVYTDSGFVASGTNRVLVVSILNTTTTPGVEHEFYPLFAEAARAHPAFTLVSEAETARAADQKGIGDDYRALVRQWETNRSFDPATLRNVADSLKAQYVLGGDVSEWSSTTVDWNVEGYSHSDVAASLKMFATTTGKRVWEARDKIELKSPLHDPRAQASGVVDDLGIQRGGRQVVPPPPPIDQAARQVATNLGSALP
jgi:hypothetical protein